MCGVSWIGEKIPPDIRHHYGGRTHGRRTIGIYDLHLDMRVAIACPDCKTMFDRWTGETLSQLPPSGMN